MAKSQGHNELPNTHIYLERETNLQIYMCRFVYFLVIIEIHMGTVYCR